MSDRIIVDKNDDLYTLADIKDFFRMLYQLNDGMAERNRYKKYIGAVESAMKRYDSTRYVPVTRCYECQHWEPENAEEFATCGHCRKQYGMCKSEQTDATWFCSDGEREG